MLLYIAYALLFIMSSVGMWFIFRVKLYLINNFPEPIVVYRNEEGRQDNGGVYFGRKLAPHTAQNVKVFANIALVGELLIILAAPLLAFKTSSLEEQVILVVLEIMGNGACALLPIVALSFPPFFYTDDSEPSKFYLEGGTPARPVSEYKELVLNP